MGLGFRVLGFGLGVGEDYLEAPTLLLHAL